MSPEPDRLGNSLSDDPPRVVPPSGSHANPLVDQIGATQHGSIHSFAGDAGLQATQLHPYSVFFEVLSHLRQHLIPAAVAVFSAAQGTLIGLGIASLIFGVALATTLVRYFTLTYQIQENDFVVSEGLWFRRVRSIPVRRIQNMDLRQNMFHKWLGVAEVRIETASGSEPEAVLRVLTLEQIERLREAIFRQAADAPAAPVAGSIAGEGHLRDTAGAADEPIVAREVVEERLLLAIPTRDFFWAGVTSNRGLVIVGVIVGFFFQGDTFRRWIARLDFGWLQSRLPSQPSGWQTGLLIAAGVLLALLLVRLIGIIWYVLRFHGYRLTRRGDDLRIHCGLLTQVTATVPRRRIQFISVHRPLLMRPLRLASLRIETAGGGGENEDDTSALSRRWFVPVIDNAKVTALLDELRPDLRWHERRDSVEWQGLSPRAGRRLLLQAIWVGLFAGGVGLIAAPPWGALLGLPLLLGLALSARYRRRSKRLAQIDAGVAYQSGIFNRKLSFAFYDRMQVLSWSQTPFDRRWQMATLAIDTAAAGPAEHQIAVHYLDEQTAERCFQQLHTAAAQHRPQWR